MEIPPCFRLLKVWEGILQCLIGPTPLTKDMKRNVIMKKYPVKNAYFRSGNFVHKGIPQKR